MEITLLGIKMEVEEIIGQALDTGYVPQIERQMKISNHPSIRIPTEIEAPLADNHQSQTVMELRNLTFLSLSREGGILLLMFETLLDK